jgi:hypothetical protein
VPEEDVTGNWPFDFFYNSKTGKYIKGLKDIKNAPN